MKPAALESGSGKKVKPDPTRSRRLFSEIWKHRMTYTLLIPGLIWLILFAYLPMGGLSLAFKEYKANLGIWGSPWVGFENFEYVFRDPAFIDAVWRTLYINILKLVVQFPFPILLALMLNELRMRRTKKLFQTVFTFPHFLSWIIVSGIVINVLAYDGLVNSALALVGLPTINFLGSEDTFVPMLLLTDIWKSTGWGPSSIWRPYQELIRISTSQLRLTVPQDCSRCSGLRCRIFFRRLQSCSS